MRCHSSIGIASGRPAARTPTLLTTTSTPPNSSHREVACGHEVVAPGDVEPLRGLRCHRAAAISPATVAARSPSTSVTRTREPRAASSWAIARPMPLPAPVTTAFAPSRSKGARSVIRRRYRPGARLTRSGARIPVMGRLRYTARLGSEFVSYSVVNRAWWVVPMVLLLGLVVALAIVVGQAAAPYTLYTLF